MLKNSRIGTIAALGVVAAIGVGSLVMASNMGFKGKFTFTTGVRQWFSPPYRSPYKTADDLLNATMPAGGVLTRTVSTAPTSFMFWNGVTGNGTPIKNFDLNAGEGYEIVPGVSNPPTYDVVLVGSHNPFTALPLAQENVPGGNTPAGFVANRDYLIAVPWHTTYLTAEDMRADLPSAQRVVKINPTSPASFSFWNGITGNETPGNFALTLGDAYEVRVLQTTPQGATPAHF